jgi:hypothetical protein
VFTGSLNPTGMTGLPLRIKFATVPNPESNLCSPVLAIRDSKLDSHLGWTQESRLKQSWIPDVKANAIRVNFRTLHAGILSQTRVTQAE